MKIQFIARFIVVIDAVLNTCIKIVIITFNNVAVAKIFSCEILLKTFNVCFAAVPFLSDKRKRVNMRTYIASVQQKIIIGSGGESRIKLAVYKFRCIAQKCKVA